MPASPLPGERGAADYADAIINKKADVRLLIHDSWTGGLEAFGARHLRYLGRRAAAVGNDNTDYSQSPTASSFVPYYTQRLTCASCMNGAKGIHKQVSLRHHQLRHKRDAARENMARASPSWPTSFPRTVM